MHKVAIVLPVLNEKKNLELLLPEIVSRHPDFFIIVIDDNSSDGTSDYLHNFNKVHGKLNTIHRPERLGIGSAHKQGLLKAIELGCEFIVTMDADGTHSVSDVKKLLELNKYFDVVIGNRYGEGAGIVGWSVHRYLLTNIGHLVTQFFFRSKLDMSSGMRSYRTHNLPMDAIVKYSKNQYDFFFTSVLVLKHYGISIGQQPIVLRGRGHGRSKMSTGLMASGFFSLLLFGFKLKRIGRNFPIK